MELINSNSNFTLEYCEKKDRYFVSDVMDITVTNLHLSFEEAKALFDALDFCNVYNQDDKEITAVIREIRKERRCERELNMRLMDLFLDN